MQSKPAKLPTIYLAGPIFQREVADAKRWRNSAKKLWYGKTLDPTRRMVKGVPDRATMERIVEQDKQDILKADAVLAFWDGTPSVGTSMELFYAYSVLSKPVVIAAPGVKDPEAGLSLWLRYHCTSIAPTLENAVVRIERLFPRPKE